MELTIVNPHPKYPRVGLIEPTQKPPPEYRKLHDTFIGAAREQYVMPARCLRGGRRRGQDQAGLFLFNFVVAEDPAVALDWAGPVGPPRRLVAVETGMNHSTLQLRPCQPPGQRHRLDAHPLPPSLREPRP